MKVALVKGQKNIEREGRENKGEGSILLELQGKFEANIYGVQADYIVLDSLWRRYILTGEPLTDSIYQAMDGVEEAIGEKITALGYLFCKINSLMAEERGICK